MLTGSHIHVLGEALAHALSMGRVLVLARDLEHPFYDAHFCPNEETFHNCYFEGLTSCSAEDIRSASGEILSMQRFIKHGYSIR